jgi:transcription elongation factor GreB
MDAPLARALLGKRLDDEVRVSTPAGERTWLITEIRYT